MFVRPKVKKVEIDIQKDEKENLATENDIVSLPEIKEEVVEEKKEEIPVSLSTTVIQANNLVESYDTIYNGVKIKNETKINLTQEDLIPNVEFLNKKDIVIFHTHTCESYTMTKENSYISTRKL